MKKISVITRIRNDAFFLKHWIRYYGEQVGEENLYVYLDGADQTLPADCGKANIVPCKRICENVVKAEKERLRFLSERAAELFKEYDLVIGVDVDEFLVVDPALNVSLQDYLSQLHIKGSVSGLGVDVGQQMDLEKSLDETKTFLSQRNYAVLSPRYTKPCVISEPLRWGSGFHRIKGHNFHIDDHLFLFHFGGFDMDMLMERFQDKDRMSTGRERHLKKRTRTIRYVSSIKAHAGDDVMPLVRTLQTYLRPIFAWNKPTLLGVKVVIKIPERFWDCI